MEFEDILKFLSFHVNSVDAWDYIYIAKCLGMIFIYCEIYPGIFNFYILHGWLLFIIRVLTPDVTCCENYFMNIYSKLIFSTKLFSVASPYFTSCITSVFLWSHLFTIVCIPITCKLHEERPLCLNWLTENEVL